MNEFEKFDNFVKDLKEKGEATCISCGGIVKRVYINGYPNFKCDKCGGQLREDIKRKR